MQTILFLYDYSITMAFLLKKRKFKVSTGSDKAPWIRQRQQDEVNNACLPMDRDIVRIDRVSRKPTTWMAWTPKGLEQESHQDDEMDTAQGTSDGR